MRLQDAWDKMMRNENVEGMVRYGRSLSIDKEVVLKSGDIGLSIDDFNSQSWEVIFSHDKKEPCPPAVFLFKKVGFLYDPANVRISISGLSCAGRAELRSLSSPGGVSEGVRGTLVFIPE